MFRRFVGIDQTGAARSGGRRARPLPCAVLERDGDLWRLAFVDLVGLTREVFAARDWCGPETAVMVDAVMGLPAPCWDRAGIAPGHEGLWTLFRRAASHEVEGRRFGRAVSADFFAELEVSGALLRRVDALCGAQSVFRQRPYQRDVQTGTFRIWSDLGGDGSAWLDVWPFADGGARAVLVEAWPSLGWRVVLGQDRRRPKALHSLLPSSIRSDAGDVSADHADAAVAALMGWWAQVHGQVWTDGSTDLTEPARRGEGWIALWSDPGA